jgi:hypothetical protein
MDLWLYAFKNAQNFLKQGREDMYGNDIYLTIFF